MDTGQVILTERFRLRPLRASDATQSYLDWFAEDRAKHIVSASAMQSLADLRAYIDSKSGRADVLFLGIFRLSDGVHIGNVKFEPVDRERGYAIAGILIGDVDSRGTGVAPEVLSACGAWLKHNWNIRQLVLGVSRENQAAIRAYE